MDINDFFISCRKGDLARVKYLIEQKEVEVNIRDKWDSTPLYYACLCGHKNVVQYLLKCGARCQANTFDGERCVYGSLTTEIRNLLLIEYQVVSSQTLRRDSYDEFLRRCLEEGEYHDIVFNINGKFIKVHRSILCVRCEYFCEKFLNKWLNKETIDIIHPQVTPEAFQAILQFLYTGRLEASLENVEDCIIVAKQCGLLELIQQIEENVKKVWSFEHNKPGTKVTRVLIENDNNHLTLQRDFGVLAERALPPQLCRWIAGNEFLPSVSNSAFGDLCFEVQNNYFVCHKVFFCGQSDYFRVLLRDHFLEASKTHQGLSVLSLQEVKLDVFVCVLYYLYQNCTELNPENAYDVLCAADLYLLPGLKRQCGSYMGQYLDGTNVVGALRTARVFKLPQLEDTCTEFIAKHLEEVVDNEDFHVLILEDAGEVRERQETDTISVIDDVRYHITSSVQTYSAMTEAEEKLALIDRILDTLGLDA